jgi:acetoin:2,6-dichlorophenolindophenol oxidoreductase subunit alpha
MIAGVTEREALLDSADSRHARHYRAMLRIRRFEERLLEGFSQGLLAGTTHTYIGQEANAVGVLEHVTLQDIVVSNHRGHGHFLAYGGPLAGLAAELFGRRTGVCSGRGGSQHLVWGNFMSSGILGGTAPLAVGMGLAEKMAGEGRIVVVFLGDGALGEGVVYESLNMAALWSTPVLFVLENNRYAQSTPIERNLAGSIEGRFAGFGIDCVSLDTTDVLEIEQAAAERVNRIRREEGPCALALATYRFAPHSKGDEDRDPLEIERFRALDPLLVHGQRLDPAMRAEIEVRVRQEIDDALAEAINSPPTDGLNPLVPQGVTK